MSDLQAFTAMLEDYRRAEAERAAGVYTHMYVLTLLKNGDVWVYIKYFSQKPKHSVQCGYEQLAASWCVLTDAWESQLQAHGHMVVLGARSWPSGTVPCCVCDANEHGSCCRVRTAPQWRTLGAAGEQDVSACLQLLLAQTPCPVPLLPLLLLQVVGHWSCRAAKQGCMLRSRRMGRSGQT